MKKRRYVKDGVASRFTRLYNRSLEDVTCVASSRADSEEKEEIIVAELLQKIDKVQIPPHILKELGLGSDWKQKISPEFVEKVVRTAVKYRDTLKELSKY